jgi:HEAT repeat protein
MLRYLRLPFDGFVAFRRRSAALLGAGCLEPRRRRGWFVGVCFALVGVAWLTPPPVGLGVLGVTLWLLVAVYFTWTENEKRRGRIAKKIDETPPDSLPRLQDLAMFTAIAVAVVLLFIFERAQECFDLFRVEDATRPHDWMWFVLDKTYLRALPDTVELWDTRIEQLHAGRIDYYSGRDGWAGRGLVFLAYSLLYLILLQGLARIWQVRRDIREGIAGVAVDPDMAVRLGRRAVRPLLKAWQKPDISPAVRANMATALGHLGDIAALPALRDAAEDRQTPLRVREAALLALGSLDRVECVAALAGVLANDDDHPVARAAAAAGLGRLTCPEAAGPLLDKLGRIQAGHGKCRDVPDVRKEVTRALGKQLGPRRADCPEQVERAVELLLGGPVKRNLLQDAYLRVRNKAAEAIGRLGHVSGLGPLTVQMRNNDNPKLLQTIATALGELLRSLGPEALQSPEGQAALAEMMAQLKQSRNDSVREAAALGLGRSGAVSVVDELGSLLEVALRCDQEGLGEALARAIGDLDGDSGARLAALQDALGHESSQRRRLAVLDDGLPMEERIRSANELGEHRDRRGQEVLERIAGNADADAALREACRRALERIRQGGGA